MKASPLDRIVTIERETVTGEDPFGSPIVEWSAWAAVPAQVVTQSGREYVAAAAVQNEARVLFRMRWLDGVSVQDRVHYDGTLHNIEAVKELGRREGTELHTTAAAS